MSSVNTDLFNYVTGKSKADASNWKQLDEDVSVYLNEANYIKTCVGALATAQKATTTSSSGSKE